MLRRANILKIIIQCLLRDINHYMKFNLRICTHYDINEALRNYIAIKNQRNRYSLI